METLKSRRLLTIKNFVYTLNKPMNFGEYIIDVGDVITITQGIAWHKFKENRSDGYTHIELPTDIKKFVENNCKGSSGVFKRIELEKIL